MDPIEINAGNWYLRALRADDRVDDRPALADGGITDPDYVGLRAAQWADGSVCSWAVCQPDTGELLAEVLLTPQGANGLLTGWTRVGHDDALTTATDAVARFAESALELTVTRG